VEPGESGTWEVSDRARDVGDGRASDFGRALSQLGPVELGETIVGFGIRRSGFGGGLRL
jgi:hypothetical protein